MNVGRDHFLLVFLPTWVDIVYIYTVPLMLSYPVPLPYCPSYSDHHHMFVGKHSHVGVCWGRQVSAVWVRMCRIYLAAIICLGFFNTAKNKAGLQGRKKVIPAKTRTSLGIGKVYPAFWARYSGKKGSRLVKTRSTDIPFHDYKGVCWHRV